MPQPDAEIRSLLETRLAVLDLVPAPAIEWQNRDFSPPASGAWLRATLAPASTSGEFLFSDRVTEVGLLLVDCFAPQGAGSQPAENLAASVRAGFPPRLELIGSTVRVLITGSDRAPGRVSEPDEAAAFIVPVTISWRCSYLAG